MFCPATQMFHVKPRAFAEQPHDETLGACNARPLMIVFAALAMILPSRAALPQAHLHNPARKEDGGIWSPPLSHL